MAFVDLCRLCGTDTLNIVRNAIFEGEGRVKKYALKISECLTLKVAEEDQLPKIMCGECSYKLDLLSDFRDEAYKTETQLLSKINVNKVKAELPDVIDSPDLDNDDLGGDDNSGSSSPEPLPEPLVEIKEEENLPKKRSPTKRSWRVLESEGEETPVKKRGRLPKQPATTPKATAATPVAAPPKENSGPTGVTVLADVYVCAVCHTSFCSDAEMQQHLPQCNNPLQPLTVEQHIAVKTSQEKAPKKSLRPYQLEECPICKMKFRHLKNHMRKHVPEQPEEKSFPCDFPGCTITCITLSRVQKHKALVHNAAHSTCQQCGLVLKDYQGKKAHLTKHVTSTEGFLRCAARGCFKIFPEAELKSHFRQTHLLPTKRPHFVCDLCGKLLESRTGFVKHFQNHSTMVPGQLKCVEKRCESVFSNCTELKEHMQVHKPQLAQFLCPKCGDPFPSQDQVMLHSENCKQAPEISIEEVMPCTFCGLYFMGEYTLSVHLKRHQTDAPGVIKCLRKKCHQRFSSAADLKQHLQSHKRKKVKCDTCGKFFTVFNLKLHIKQMHWSKPMQCKAAGCSFSTRDKREFNKHKKFEHDLHCPLCDKTSTARSKIKIHMKLHETGIAGVYKCSVLKCKSLRFHSVDDLKEHYAFNHNNTTPQWCLTTPPHTYSRKAKNTPAPSNPPAEYVPPQHTDFLTDELKLG